jgi:hypothetical protein
MPIVPLDRLEQFAAVNVRLDPGAIGGPVHVPSCAQITLVWQLTDGKEGHNVLYGRYAGSFSGTILQADAILAALTASPLWTALATHFATTTSLHRVNLRDVNTPDQPIIEGTVSEHPGTSIATALPDEVAECISLHTGLGGKRNRGRMYLPAMTHGETALGGVILPDAVTDAQAWANTDIFSALSGSGYTWVIGQKARQAYTGSSGTAHPARDASSEIITEAIMRDNHWDTIRKRGLS